MKIVELYVEGIKRIRCVHIKPKNNMVVLSGKNQQGKTSVMDSIAWALSNSKIVQPVPINTDSEKGVIRIRLKGEDRDFLIEKTFKRRGEQEIASLKVTAPDGAVYDSPTELLGRFLGKLTFDPLKFATMEAKQQLELLRSLVPNIDFDEIERLNKLDYDKRTDVNRRAHAASALLDSLVIGDKPEVTEDVDELTLKISEAIENNSKIESEKNRRVNLLSNLASKENEIRQLDQNIVDLKARIDELREQGRVMVERRKEMLAAAKAQDEMISSLPQIPSPVNFSDINARISVARAAEEKLKQWHDSNKKRTELERLAESLEAESRELTNAQKRRIEEKEAAIASAKLPIEGLGFGEGEVVLNGLPLVQASEAVKLETSVALGIALNRDLNIMLVRNASLLDDEGMALIERMAADRDIQMWVERVATGEPVGFVLEDGMILESSPALAAEA